MKDECNLCHERLDPREVVKETGKAKRCNKCMRVVYCNAECQKIDLENEVFPNCWHNV